MLAESHVALMAIDEGVDKLRLNPGNIGDKDRVAPLKEVQALIEKLKTQKGIAIEHAVIANANHFFEDCMEDLQETVGAYLDKRLGMPRHAPPPARKDRAKSSTSAKG